MMRVRLQLTLGIGLLVFSSHFTSAEWVQTNGPEGGMIDALAVSGDTIFAGTYRGGVFLSMNNGANWTAANTGLSNGIITSFAVCDSALFTCVQGNGVWRRPLSDFSATGKIPDNHCGCGTGTGLALIPPLWFKWRALKKRNTSNNPKKTGPVIIK